MQVDTRVVELLGLVAPGDCRLELPSEEMPPVQLGEIRHEVEPLRNFLIFLIAHQLLIAQQQSLDIDRDEQARQVAKFGVGHLSLRA